MKNQQLADLLRPRTFDDIVGQDHLFGERGVVRRMVGSGRITNMIFFGPPGTGKTTASHVIAAESGMSFYKLNATTASLSDVREILAGTDSLFGAGGTLLYIDERRAGYDSIINIKMRIFGGGRNEGHTTVLDVFQKRLLLLAIEILDLIDIQQRPPRTEQTVGSGKDLAHVRQ